MPAKKFKFRLEPLLSIKEHREKQCQKDHAVAASAVDRQKGQIAGIDRDRLETMDYQRQRSVGPLSIAASLASSRFLVKLKRDRMEGTEFLKALEKKAEEKRRILVQAARERKIFERLKEKQSLRFREEAEKAEQKELDEVAVTAFVRRGQKKRG